MSSGLAGTLQGFFWLSAGLGAITAILGGVGLGTFNDFWDARPGPQARSAYVSVESADDAINGFIAISGLVFVVVFVLLIVWSNQAHKATQDL